MSQRRARGNQPATVNYKEMYEEAEQELAEMQGRLDEIANLAAPEVDHERLERIELALAVLLKDRFGEATAEDKTAAQELVQQMEEAHSGE